MKIDVFSLPRVERKPETRTFREPSTGFEIEITLRAGNAADAAMANSHARRLTEDYILGSEIREAGPFPDPEVKVSEQLFLNWAMIAEMQPERVYDTIELIILADRAPTVGNAILMFAGELNQRHEAQKKTSPEPKPASSPASSSTSATSIPN